MDESVAISADCQTLAFEKWSADGQKSILSVYEIGASDLKSQVVLSDPSLKLKGIYGHGKETKILFQGLAETNNQFASFACILDSSCKELRRSKIASDFVSDATLSKIVSISPHVFNGGEPLSVKVWLPNQGKEHSFSLDTSTVLTALNDAIKK